MAISSFVPEVWSARLQRHLDRVLIYAQPTVTNRDYEGEITDAGDTVNIQKVGNPTIVSYVKGTPMTPERPDGTTQALTIDRDKGFYIQMDDLDAVQVNVPLFDRFTERAGIQMAKTLDADIAARMVAGAGAGNIIATDGTPATIKSGGTYTTFYAFAVEARRKLDLSEASSEGRWMVVNPDLESRVLLDAQFIPAGADEQRTGKIGQIAGFDILKTTGTPDSPGSGGSPKANWKVLFGAGNYSVTVATQLVKTEAERLQGLFEDAVKGRNVWGAKVIEPATLGLAHIDKSFS